jgi:hypothetical protein
MWGSNTPGPLCHIRETKLKQSPAGPEQSGLPDKFGRLNLKFKPEDYKGFI